MKKIVLIGIISTIIFSACSDFLDLSPISEASVVNFYKTQSDIEIAVNGAYAGLQSNNLYRSDYVTMMEVRSDNVEDNNPGGSAGIHYNVDQFIAKSDNPIIRGVWKKQYNQIYRINNIIASLEVVKDTELKVRYEGEAKFLRALAYFNIVRLWGAAPLVLTPITTKESYDLIRESEAKIYATIEADLEFAQQLPKEYNEDKDLGRATSGAAKTLLAKVYLTQKKYSNAVTLLQELTNSYTDVYGLQINVADVYDFSNEMNNEIIFAIRYGKTIPDETNSIHPAYFKFDLDSELLNAYESSDERKDLLSLIEINNSLIVKKFADFPDPITGGVGFDFPLLRYSDVLLMYAEALNEVGYSSDKNSPAFKALNNVRSRAKTSIYTNVELNNQNAFREAVLFERRLEMPLENHRWFDLLRTGKAVEAMSAVGLTITSTDFLYPIPDTEINIMNNPEGFPQNPGY